MMQRLNGALRELGYRSEAFSRANSTAVAGRGMVNPEANGFLELLEKVSYSIENRFLKAGACSFFSKLHLPHITALYDSRIDIAHLHWVARWLDLPSFISSLPLHAGVVWTVHDMSPLAGGCFTDFGCGKFGNGCRVCPLLKFPFNRIWARQELKRRIRALAQRRVAFVANSNSTMALVKRSEVAEGKVQKVIPPGFDFTELKATSREKARAALGIPEEAFVLGFGAESLTDGNKGIDRFYEVARLVRQEIPQAMALIFGSGNPEAAIPTRKMMKMNNMADLALAYSAMDAHVVTSKMETFGLVAVEAQACGTPVFAFAVGGVPETLLDGKTGVLVPFGQCKEMVQQILAVHRTGRLEAMGQAGAEWVRGQFDSLVVAQKYVEVYEELLAGDVRG